MNPEKDHQQAVLKCNQCDVESVVTNTANWYFLQHLGRVRNFCSKHHLQEWLRLGRDGVVICEPAKRYEPSPEDEERMRM